MLKILLAGCWGLLLFGSCTQKMQPRAAGMGTSAQAGPVVFEQATVQFVPSGAGGLNHVMYRVLLKNWQPGYRIDSVADDAGPLIWNIDRNTPSPAGTIWLAAHRRSPKAAVAVPIEGDPTPQVPDITPGTYLLLTYASSQSNVLRISPLETLPPVRSR